MPRSKMSVSVHRLSNNPALMRLLLCFVLPEYLVWIQTSIQAYIRMANSDMKESQHMSASSRIPQQLYPAAHQGRCWYPC